MATIISYKAGVYCQIRFSNGERVLITSTASRITLFKLGLFGLFATKTIAEWRLSQLESAMELFVDPSKPAAHPVDAIRDKLLKTCASVAEVQDLARRVPQSHPEAAL
jgi:hypothetical protein